MADAGELKNMNTGAIRRILKAKGTMSKNELARETGLSFPTIGRAVDSMLSTGELLEKGAGTSTGGRCAQLYAINPLYRVITSLYLEAEELHWFISDLSGECVERGKEICDEGILKTIDTLIRRIQVRYPQLGAIAMGVAANVREGIMQRSFGYSELWGVNLSAYLNNISGLPCAVEGDMQIVSTGFWSRCIPPKKAVVCIYLGKMGIGGGAVIDGRAWHGASAFAGELHYLPIEHNMEYAQTHFKGADIVDYYSKIITSYIAILNPDRIILYDNELISGQANDIRIESVKNIPPHNIPQIEVSNEFEEDYRRGLFVFGNRLLD